MTTANTILKTCTLQDAKGRSVPRQSRDDDPMLGQRCRRWTNIDPASGHRLVFADTVRISPTTVSTGQDVTTVMVIYSDRKWTDQPM